MSIGLGSFEKIDMDAPEDMETPKYMLDEFVDELPEDLSE